MAFFVGNSTSELLNGGAEADRILGLGGDDALSGFGAADIIYGGEGGDSIFDGDGGGSGDRMYGEKGDDRFESGDSSGGDLFHGGFGADTFEIVGSLATRIDLKAPSANTGIAAGDRLISIEKLRGGGGNDRFFGADVNEAFLFSRGNNFYSGRGGLDLYEAGEPQFGATEINLELAYGSRAQQLATQRGITLTDSTSGVVVYETWVDGNNNNVRDAGETTFQIDELRGIEQYIGLRPDDILAGSSVDELFLLAGGAASVNGGGGFDFISFSDRGFSASGVTIDLAANTVAGGAAATLASIEGAIGSSFGDQLIGTSLGNVLIGGSGGQDLLDGGGGNDRLDGGSDIDLLLGAVGDDLLVGGPLGDVIDGGDGSDTVSYAWTPGVIGITVSLAAGTATGGLEGTGDSLIDVENVIGSDLGDTITGDALANRLEGRASADVIFGGGGNDLIFAGAAPDSPLAPGVTTFDPTAVIGDSPAVEAEPGLPFFGPDNLSGQSGNDTIVGGADSEIMSGGAGDDRMETGSGGFDQMLGGAGNDTYVVSQDSFSISERAGEGTDEVLSSVGVSTLAANVENLTLTGTAAIDATGNGAANRITGNSAANVLSGGNGADILSGGVGDDLLEGDLGADQLTGGAGKDGFEFDTGIAKAANVDAITDFVPVDDTILLDREIFAAIAVEGTLGAGSFRLAATAADANDFILYDRPTGRIFYDADGNGTNAAPILFATVTPNTNLTAADFVAFG